MGAVDLLLDLLAEGVEFDTDGERIRWRDADHRLTPERLKVLQDGKSEVLEYLCTDARPDEYRHGLTFDGTPKTWTGKVVSLDAWRQLSEWERHGPDGRHWNGLTRRWERLE